MPKYMYIKKRVGKQRYPNQLYESIFSTKNTLKYGESHDTDADKHAFTSLLQAAFQKQVGM